MKIRTLVVAIWGVLVVSSVSSAQEVGPVEPELREPAFSEPKSRPSVAKQVAASRLNSVRPPRRSATLPALPTPAASNASKNPMEVSVFKLKYARAVDMAAMIENVFRREIHFDQRLNRLILNATKEETKSIMSLIEEMDVADREASAPREIQDFVYRIYMFEIASGDRDLKPFSMTLRASAQVPPQDFLDATADDGLQISEFLQTDRGLPEPRIQILIQGKAASNASLMRLVERIPKPNITELKWDDDETFTDGIAAAQYTQLPEQMQKHIRKFLGNDIRTVGYWFGNLSVPGTVHAPIGPWTLSLVLEPESDSMLELRIDVEMFAKIAAAGKVSSRRYNILSNSIRAKIGKPIIIGYNRESYGTRKMGAMVIIPEPDPFQSDNTETKFF